MTIQYYTHPGNIDVVSTCFSTNFNTAYHKIFFLKHTVDMHSTKWQSPSGDGHIGCLLTSHAASLTMSAMISLDSQGSPVKFFFMISMFANSKRTRRNKCNYSRLIWKKQWEIKPRHPRPQHCSHDMFCWDAFVLKLLKFVKFAGLRAWNPQNSRMILPVMPVLRPLAQSVSLGARDSSACRWILARCHCSNGYVDPSSCEGLFVTYVMIMSSCYSCWKLTPLQNPGQC